MSAAIWGDCIGYLAFIGLVSLPIGAMLPRELFHSNRFPFRMMKWEREGQAYEKLRIRAWKDKVPDASKVVRFLVRKKLAPAVQADQVERLVQETCVAELTHMILIMLGLRCILIAKNAAGLLISALWSLANLVFVVIQRYNRPVLARLAQMLRQRERVVLFQPDSKAHGELYSNGHTA